MADTDLGNIRTAVLRAAILAKYTPDRRYCTAHWFQAIGLENARLAKMNGHRDEKTTKGAADLGVPVASYCLVTDRLAKDGAPVVYFFCVSCAFPKDRDTKRSGRVVRISEVFGDG